MDEFKVANKIVRKTISEDDELYYSYQANIAMSFYDEYRKSEKKYKNKGDIHTIANEAAKNFLNMWIKQ